MGRTLGVPKSFTGGQDQWLESVRITPSTKPRNQPTSRYITPTINAALGAIYPNTSGVPARGDTVTATIASLSDISSLAPSCANPLVSGTSFPTKGRGARYPECPTPYEAFAQEGRFPAPQMPPLILPNLSPRNAPLARETNGPPRLRTIQTFPRHSLSA
jgi:hypothetical protein